MNVSVVLPSFNRARLLPITIPTYFQEDVSEVILVDDCSTDRSKQIISAYDNVYENICICNA